MGGSRGARRAAFWVGVGGVAVLSEFLVSLAAARFPQLGLAKFVSFKNQS